MTSCLCPHIVDLYERLTAKLGPDPLREDADGELVWARMQASRKPVGLVLMDQSMIAGIGNIYRAEILFKARSGLWHVGQACTRLPAVYQARLLRQYSLHIHGLSLCHLHVVPTSCAAGGMHPRFIPKWS